MDEKDARRAIAIVALVRQHISKQPTRISSNEGYFTLRGATYSSGKFKVGDGNGEPIVAEGLTSSTFEVDYGSYTGKIQIKMSGDTFTAHDLNKGKDYRGEVTSDSKVTLNGGGVTDLEFTIY